MIWLTDDNFGTGQRPKEIAEEIIAKQLPDDVTWFVQARCDDIIRNKDILPRLAKSGLSWVLLGVENSNPSTLGLLQKRHYTQRCKNGGEATAGQRHLRPRHGHHRQPQRNPPIHPPTARIRQRLRPRLHHVRHPNAFSRHRSLRRSRTQRLDRRPQLEPLRHDPRHNANRNALHPSDTRGTLWLLPRLLRLMEQAIRRILLK